MHAVSEVIVLAVTVSVAVFLFLAGELVAMKSGYAYTEKATVPTDATYTASAIKPIEGRLHKEARNMLETRLENYILNHHSASHGRWTGLNPFIKEKSHNDNYYSTIIHRKSSPSSDELVAEHSTQVGMGRSETMDMPGLTWLFCR